jgi:hypothetical protein
MATVGSIPHPTQNEMWQIKWTADGVGDHHSHYLAFEPAVSLAQYKEWRKIPGLLPDWA